MAAASAGAGLAASVEVGDFGTVMLAPVGDAFVGAALAAVVVLLATVGADAEWLALVVEAGAAAEAAVAEPSLAAAGAATAPGAAAAATGAGCCAAVADPDELDPHAETISARLEHTGTASTARLTREVRNVNSFSATAAQRTAVPNRQNLKFSKESA